MKKVKKSINEIKQSNPLNLDFYNKELKKEDVIARNLKDPKNSLGIFTDFAFDGQGNFVGNYKPESMK